MKSPHSRGSKEFLPHVIIRLYLPPVSVISFNLRAVPSFPLYVVCHVEMFCVMLLPHQIVLLLPSRVCVWHLNSGKVMVVQGSQVSRREGERRGEGFVKKRRNSSDWQMKSVHSSKAAPYRQPVKQSQALNGGQDNGGAQYWNPPIEDWRDRQKVNTICLTAGEEFSFSPPRLQSFICCAKLYRLSFHCLSHFTFYEHCGILLLCFEAFAVNVQTGRVTTEQY